VFNVRGLDVFEERLNSIGDEIRGMEDIVEVFSGRQFFFDKIFFVIDTDKQTKGTSE